MSRRSRPSGRVDRLKLLTALSLLAAMLVGLALFGIVIAIGDARFERDRIDSLLERHVDAAVATVGRGQVDDVALPAAERTYELFVVEAANRDVASETPRVVLASDGTGSSDHTDVVEAAGAALEQDHRVLRSASIAGVSVRVLARPVPGTDEPRFAVVGVARTALGDERHDRLVTLMIWSAATIVVVGAGLAWLLARGRWWLVDRALARHERFLSEAAHELRTPIAGLRAVTAAGLSGEQPPDRALEQAAVLAHDTEEVIDDLLTLSRLEQTGELEGAEPMRLDQLVEAVVHSRQDDVPVQLRLHESVVVANAHLVRRAVANLVDNAVRHGRSADPRAAITVTVDECRVRVLDRGPGIEPQLLSQLAERVQSGRGGGGGLGLLVAGWVARVHGGTIEAENVPSGGAQFTLILLEAAP